MVVGFGSYYHLIISLTTNTSLNFYKKAWSTLNDPDWASNLDALTIQFKSKSRVQVNCTICNNYYGVAAARRLAAAKSRINRW